ncbi:Bifunctional protein PutA [invertebrate metagenome]|uniref:L-glutamate gamma-semialdehyde dehydrogenase n=1 Tax=invertebrate metagenome TaxID=1711999 RepID=A0A2H9TA97_9ZZZZ
MAHNTMKAEYAFQGDIAHCSSTDLWQMISPHYTIDEAHWLAQLIPFATLTDQQSQAVDQKTEQLIHSVRQQHNAVQVLDELLQEYSLNNQEGLALMSLAETLLRIPDTATADALIHNKITSANWQAHLKQSSSKLVNASTRGLLLTHRLLSAREDQQLHRIIMRLGEPVVRHVIHRVMKIMGRHFVVGETIHSALSRSKKNRNKGVNYSFDMLGEAALTQSDAHHYFTAYQQAISEIGSCPWRDTEGKRPTVSIKLSALHPRYEPSQSCRIMTELFETLQELALLARKQDVGLTIDAEEQERLELSLLLFEKLYHDPVTQGWDNLGLAVQAYGKRALPLLCWLSALAQEQGDRIPVRLVKGAYWDSEIKRSQQLGLSSYPVYTQKEGTDISYLVCARFLLSDAVQPHLFPQFASHNAQTLASLLVLGKNRNFECQRLHGMGKALYKTLRDQAHIPTRIYAPVGNYQHLLPYLVRRLLENSANSSFVHKLTNPEIPVGDLITQPVQKMEKNNTLTNPAIPLPEAIYGASRKNSSGINLAITNHRTPFLDAVSKFSKTHWQSAPILDGHQATTGSPVEILSPYDQHQLTGTVLMASPIETEQALANATKAFRHWHTTSVEQRAQYLESLAEQLEQNTPELVALCQREAGKTLQDSMDEVREAVDFCRYYAQEARKLFTPQELQGVTGENNTLYLTGRGVFICISPWNFPLAIFMGQIAAALVAGNTVIAKPAEQTSLIAAKAVSMIFKAGFPEDVIQLLPGEGAVIGQQLTSDPRIAGVAFTGSTATARKINQNLANKTGAIVPFIAETGGQNAMIVDSTALLEQTVTDVIQSAFASAGQRCSALRLIYVQKDIADPFINLLAGAIHELETGDPSLYKTDVGPVIDEQAQNNLQTHISHLEDTGCLLAQAPLPQTNKKGFWIRPCVFEINHSSQLKQEHFGPVLHLIRYEAKDLKQVVNDINDTGYGLTLGIQSRNNHTVDMLEQSLRTGNTYINRNQIGATVGTQPFGGMGLSGTGPKAGGPHYLLRFATERVKTVNTTASGGNATLLSLIEK